jgi:hypothetical protein
MATPLFVPYSAQPSIISSHHKFSIFIISRVLKTIARRAWFSTKKKEAEKVFCAFLVIITKLRNTN